LTPHWQIRKSVVVIAFLLTAFFIGFVIVYIVPKVNGWVAQAPYGSQISSNKFAQLLMVDGWPILATLVLARVGILTFVFGESQSTLFQG
jgi:hypothetical protein